MSIFRITNPLDTDNKVVIPKGTVIRTTHPTAGPVRVAARKQTVSLYGVSPGWIDREYDNEGGVIFPTVSWAGAGGYWCDVQVTPELAAANGVKLPELPVPDENGRIDRYHLAVTPSYEDGYTNRWSV